MATAMYIEMQKQLKEISSVERPDIAKIIATEQNRKVVGQLNAQKIDLRQHMNSEVIIK